jgi:hypothetical protein
MGTETNVCQSWSHASAELATCDQGNLAQLKGQVYEIWVFFN